MLIPDATPTEDMSMKPKAHLVGGGIGSLAAAAFMIRDGKLPGQNISILEEMPVLGGSLDGAGDPEGGYSLRGGRMLTTDNYECTWDLYRSIPSLNNKGKSVFEETVEFNERHKPHSMARLVDRRRAKVPVTSMGFSMQDRVELLKLSRADEDELGESKITDWRVRSRVGLGAMGVTKWLSCSLLSTLLSDAPSDSTHSKIGCGLSSMPSPPPKGRSSTVR